MKKVLISLSAIVLLSLAFSGCWWDKNKEENSDENNIITSISEAMNTGKTMKCTYSDNSNPETQSIVYVKNNIYKSEYSLNGTTFYSLFDGSTIYSWPIEDGKGYKIDQQCLAELNQSTDDQSSDDSDFNLDNTFTTEDDLDSALNVKCEYVDNADLNVPNDIDFVDQCQLMKDAMDAFNNLDTNFDF